MSSTKKVPLNALRFDVEFIPWESTAAFEENIENSEMPDVADQSFESNESTKEKKFTAVAYSGKMIANHPFWGNLIFDTNNLRAKREIPILLNHNHDQIVGVGSLMVKDSVVEVEGKIFHSSEFGKKVSSFAKEGFPWQQSVHIEPQFIDKLPEGQSTMVNGQEVEGPITIFRNSVIKESSFVPLGADSNTSANVFADNDQETIELEENVMSEEVKTEEVKTEEPKALFTFTDGEYKAVEAGEYKVSEQDYQFACSCQDKTSEKKEEKTRDGNKELEELKKQFEALKKENEELKAKMRDEKKKKRFSDLAEVETKLGLTFSDVSKNALVELQDDAFSAHVSELLEAKAAQVDEQLFFEDKKGADKVDVNNPSQLRFAANKIVEDYKAQGKHITFDNAIKVVSGKNSL